MAAEGPEAGGDVATVAAAVVAAAAAAVAAAAFCEPAGKAASCV